MARNNCRNEELNRLRQRYGGVAGKERGGCWMSSVSITATSASMRSSFLGNGLPTGPGGG